MIYDSISDMLKKPPLRFNNSPSANTPQNAAKMPPPDPFSENDLFATRRKARAEAARCRKMQIAQGVTPQTTRVGKKAVNCKSSGDTNSIKGRTRL